MRAEGSCLCGSVTYSARSVESGLNICHCSMCRRWVGGPTFSVAAHGVLFQGEENIVRYPSSASAVRGFCKICGSSLFYKSAESDHYSLGLGSMKNQESFRISEEIHINQKPQGYDFEGSHPRLTGAEAES